MIMFALGFASALALVMMVWDRVPASPEPHRQTPLTGPEHVPEFERCWCCPDPRDVALAKWNGKPEPKWNGKPMSSLW